MSLEESVAKSAIGGASRILLAPVFLLFEITASLLPGMTLAVLIAFKRNPEFVRTFDHLPFGYKTKIAVGLLLCFVAGRVLCFPGRFLEKWFTDRLQDDRKKNPDAPESLKHLAVGIFFLPSLFGRSEALTYIMLVRTDCYFSLNTGLALLIASAIPGDGILRLIELGSGSSDKTRLLLDALRDAGTLRCYVPVDVSEPALAAAGKALSAEYPGLDVRAVVSDFEERLGFPADGEAPAPRLVAFLGSTIGNLEPGPRAAFLARVRDRLRPGDFFLLGTDLVKDPATLVAAYDDEAGVTAEFNKNVLAVLNAELGADFDLDAFEHVAVWNADAEWIEMRLRSCMAQTVRLPGIGLTVEFADGEEMRTEVSAKFRREGVAGELAAAGFTMRSWWTDTANQFGLSLSVPALSLPALSLPAPSVLA